MLRFWASVAFCSSSSSWTLILASASSSFFCSSSERSTSLLISLSLASSSALSLRLYFSRNWMRWFLSNNFCFILETSSKSSSLPEFGWMVWELWMCTGFFFLTFRSYLATWISFSSLLSDSLT